MTPVETATAVERADASVEAFRMRRESYARDCEHGALARTCIACDAEESALEIATWKARTDYWRSRFMDARDSLTQCDAMISQLIGDREMAEARGRAQGRLSGLFAAWCGLYPRTGGMGHTIPGAHDTDFASVRDLIAALAAEATDAS